MSSRITEQQRELTGLGALAAAAAINQGRITSEELVAACLARIDEVEESIGAWAFLDQQHARAQAKAADEARRLGRPLGALHGVPIGIKDVIDTADMPTEDGTVLHAGRRPHRDATVVSLLRAAGAVILGKTATTELASDPPSTTLHPRDTRRTPVPASRGSAAAVATRMVPLAVGTQARGALIEAASDAGVVGYTPTRGLISRTGILRQSRLLDRVGVYTRSLPDAALLAQSLMAFDASDPDMRPGARPRLSDFVTRPLPLPPQFTFVKTRPWGEIAPDTRSVFAGLVELLGDRVTELALPEQFDEAEDGHRLIREADLALSLAPEYQRGKAQLGSFLRETIERGERHRAVDYNRAVARIALYNLALEDVFRSTHAILTPAATAQQPHEPAAAGSASFCTLWTLCGLPAVTVPIMRDVGGKPIGVQLVGPRGDDERLLQCARWLADRVGENAFAAAKKRGASHGRTRPQPASRSKTT